MAYVFPPVVVTTSLYLFHLAIQQRKAHKIDQLLKDGHDPKASDHQGRTPLHCAVNHNCIGIVSILIPLSDLNAGDQLGRTPLHLAVRNGFEDISLLLLEHQANANTQDIDGKTPLHFSATCRQPVATTKALLQNGARPDIQAEDGCTALNWACFNNSTAAVHIRLHYGADVESQDNKHCKPLHWAEKHGNKGIREKLIQAVAIKKRQEEEREAAQRWGGLKDREDEGTV